MLNKELALGVVEYSQRAREPLVPYIILIAYRYIVLKPISLSIKQFFFLLSEFSRNKGNFKDSYDDNYELPDEYKHSIDKWDNKSELLDHLKAIAEKMADDKGFFASVEALFYQVDSYLQNEVSIRDILRYLMDAEYSVNRSSIFDPSFMRPSDVVMRLIVEGIKLDNVQSVLDPACKFPGNLLSQVVKHKPNISLTGYEQSGLAALMAEINLRVLGDVDVRIEALNPLLKSQDDGSRNDKFDTVISNPPYGGVLLNEVKKNPLLSSLPKNAKTEVAFLLYGLNQVADNGKAAFVLPVGILDAPNYDELRKELISSYSLNKVVLLPSGIFINTAIKTCILFFDKAIETKSIHFVDAQSLGEKVRGEFHIEEKEYNHLLEVINQKNSSEYIFSVSVEKEKVLELSANLNPLVYLKKNVAKDLALNFYEIEKEYLTHWERFNVLSNEMNSLISKVRNDKSHGIKKR